MRPETEHEFEMPPCDEQQPGHPAQDVATPNKRNRLAKTVRINAISFPQPARSSAAMVGLLRGCAVCAKSQPEVEHTIGPNALRCDRPETARYAQRSGAVLRWVKRSIWKVRRSAASGRRVEKQNGPPK